MRLFYEGGAKRILYIIKRSVVVPPLVILEFSSLPYKTRAIHISALVLVPWLSGFVFRCGAVKLTAPLYRAFSERCHK